MEVLALADQQSLRTMGAGVAPVAEGLQAAVHEVVHDSRVACACSSHSDVQEEPGVASDYSD